MEPIYLSIEPEKTGKKIKKLLDASGYTVRDVQRLMGFNNPQAIYKWLSGKSLPSIDNFVILSRLLHTSIDNLLVVDGEVVLYMGYGRRESIFILRIDPHGSDLPEKSGGVP